MTIPLQTRRTAPFHRPFPEFPDAEQLLAYGSLSFLYMRAEKYDRIAFQDMRRLIQPPVDLRYYFIHYIDGVPRAAITWGFLSAGAEAKIIAGKPLAPGDWASGDRAWIMELIAPYAKGNFGARLTRSYLASLPENHISARFPRFDASGRLKHLIEFRRTDGDRWTSHRITAAALQRTGMEFGE